MLCFSKSLWKQLIHYSTFMFGVGCHFINNRNCQYNGTNHMKMEV